jgi:16S rRNA (guanine527-N7)-methyltransferase
MNKLIHGSRKLGIELTPEQLERFELYYQELIDWNRRLNLTGITDYEDVQLKHFLDAITITSVFSTVDQWRDLSVIDIGTGAGFPGIPVIIVVPDIRLVLLEATAKKAEFLHNLVIRLGLDNVEIKVGRAEEVARDSGYRERFDVVLSRAVAALASLAELSLPFCKVGGILVAQKKGNISDEVEQSRKAVSLLGGCLREVRKIELDELPDGRCLVIIEKVEPTSSKYPRRPGIPVKRQLGK